MLTNAALVDRIAPTSHIGVPARHTSSLFARAADRVNQFFCGLSGHGGGLLRHVENGRLTLQCVSCGYETPGWDLKTRLHSTR